MNNKGILKTPAEIEFAVFCIENTAAFLKKDAADIYQVLNRSRILWDYIIPCYDVLHTQSRDYIVQDIAALMKEKQALL